MTEKHIPLATKQELKALVNSAKLHMQLSTIDQDNVLSFPIKGQKIDFICNNYRYHIYFYPDTSKVYPKKVYMGTLGLLESSKLYWKVRARQKELEELHENKEKTRMREQYLVNCFKVLNLGHTENERK